AGVMNRLQAARAEWLPTPTGRGSACPNRRVRDMAVDHNSSTPNGSSGPPNPIHTLIARLSQHIRAACQCHQASTIAETDQTQDVWRAIVTPFCETFPTRRKRFRNGSDSAKETPRAAVIKFTHLADDKAVWRNGRWLLVRMVPSSLMTWHCPRASQSDPPQAEVIGQTRF